MSSTYRTVCPNCGGNNYSVWNDASKGTYCWNCQYTEKQSTTPVRVLRRSTRIPEIRAYYLELSKYWHSCLSTEHRNYLYSRGISDYSINSLQLGYCPPHFHPLYNAGIAVEAGVFYRGHIQLADRITFPFLVDKEITDFYGRALDPSAEVKYLGLFGGAWKRGADYCYLHNDCYIPEAHERIVRTEGIIKGIISRQYGVPCVCNPGTLAHRPGTTPLAGQDQIIIYDNQVHHRRELISAIKKEASYYSKPKIGTLPLRGKEKQDIDSYILEYGVTDYLRIVNGAKEYSYWLQLIR